MKRTPFCKVRKDKPHQPCGVGWCECQCHEEEDTNDDPLA